MSHYPLFSANPRPESWQSEFLATLRLAAPLAAANLLQMAVHAIDVIFVARLGEEALSAATLAVAIHGLLMWCMMGLTGAAAPIIAAALGRRRHAVREIRQTIRMAIWLGIIAGALAMLANLRAVPIMLAMGYPPALAQASGDFLGILMWSMIPAIAANTLRIFVAALGRAGIATLITLFALFANALGNYMLVFGNWGAPALGLTGSGLSSVITSLLMLAAYALVIVSDRQFHRYRLMGNCWRSHWSCLYQLLRIGTPIALSILAEAGLFTAAAFLMARIGKAELAGHAIALQIAALAFQIPFGIAQAATIRVGIAYGAGNSLWITRAGYSAIVLTIGFMTALAAAMWLFPLSILSLYVDVDAPRNASMISFALQYLAIAAAFQLFDGTQAVFMGALRGLQDTRTPMLYAIFGYWTAGFGAAIVLGFHTRLAGVGVWIGLAIGLIVVAALLLMRWKNRKRLGLLPAAATRKTETARATGV